MISVQAETLRDLPGAVQYEWLETNGLGGYAMGTAAGVNTRRYHGLLCAALRPPLDRRMLVNKLEDEFRMDDTAVALSANLYDDVVHPEGHRHLDAFRLDPWPTWVYSSGACTIEKSLLMPNGHNAVIVHYACREAESPVKLRCKPLLSWRDHHHLSTARVEFHPKVRIEPGRIRIDAGDDFDLLVGIDNGRFWPASEWYYGFTYPRESQRGLDAVEDLYCPGQIEWDLRAGQSVAVVFSVTEEPGGSAEETMQAERRRRAAIAEAATCDDQPSRTLCLAADQFVVARSASAANGKTIIAGYPWFTDWGRDTMISLPGLLLARGRHDDARHVLAAYADAMRDGLIPNVFADQSTEAAYNTVDATLWMFAAVHWYHEATRDLSIVRDLMFDPLNEAFNAHVEGTRHGIGMDEDGLLWAGDETTQLTWMDAKVGDWVVTPRHGKAVEINGLWYSAVRTLAHFARLLDAETDRYTELARRIRHSFTETFWSEELGYFYDCVRGDYVDGSLRPNQVIALALPYTPVEPWQARSALSVIEKRLLTPYGLRTLSPDDDNYRGRYEGDQWARDGTYHQGTVWPWLIGPFLRAHLTYSDDVEQTRRWARELLQPLIDHLKSYGLGSICEIFDGDPPFEPRGCPAQAWSVAEVLRLWIEHDLGAL